MATTVSSEAWAKLRDWASVAGRGRLLLSGSIAHASLKTAVFCLIDRMNDQVAPAHSRVGWSCERVA